MFLSISDVIILSIIGLIIFLVIYFSVWKNRKSPCKGCPYAKNCISKNDDNGKKK